MAHALPNCWLPDVVRSIATNATARALRKVALVAQSDFIYAMMRMYEGYASANKAECFVGRDAAEALQWLLNPTPEYFDTDR